MKDEAQALVDEADKILADWNKWAEDPKRLRNVLQREPMTFRYLNELYTFCLMQAKSQGTPRRKEWMDTIHLELKAELASRRSTKKLVPLEKAMSKEDTAMTLKTLGRIRAIFKHKDLIFEDKKGMI